MYENETNVWLGSAVNVSGAAAAKDEKPITLASNVAFNSFFIFTLSKLNGLVG